MKCERLFFAIFLASVFLFTIFGLETKGGSALQNWKKAVIPIPKAVTSNVPKRDILTQSSCFWPKESTSTP